MPEKLSKYPNFLHICPKNLQNSGILRDFCPKNARILHNNYQKNILFPNFKGARAVCAPRLSNAYARFQISGYATAHKCIQLVRDWSQLQQNLRQNLR